MGNLPDDERRFVNRLIISREGTKPFHAEDGIYVIHFDPLYLISRAVG